MLYGKKIFNNTEGKLVNIPGLPAMYYYEYFPQDFRLPLPLSRVSGSKFRGGYFLACQCMMILSRKPKTSLELDPTLGLIDINQWRPRSPSNFSGNRSLASSSAQDLRFVYLFSIRLYNHHILIVTKLARRVAAFRSLRNNHL